MSVRRGFLAWLTDETPDTGPTEATRDHIRGWLVNLRRQGTQNTTRADYAGVRHFYRWLLAEDEIEADPCEGIRSPAPAEPETLVVAPDDLRHLLEGRPVTLDRVRLPTDTRGIPDACRGASATARILWLHSDPPGHRERGSRSSLRPATQPLRRG